MAGERSVSEVLRDIVRDGQEMVRSEIRLAKVEIRDDIKQAMLSSVWIVAGAIGAVSAWMLLLWAAVFALATRMPMWAAALIVGGVMGAVAAVLITGGIRRATRIQPIPERAVESVKENLEWMKQHAR